MSRLALLALLGCGRVGFEPRQSSPTPADGPRDGLGDGPHADGTQDSTPGICSWVQGCPFPKITCCTQSGPVCQSAGTCIDPIVACDVTPPFGGCTATQTCCDLGSGAGAMCFANPGPC